MTASIQERREIAERLKASIGEGLLGLYSAVLGDDAKNRTAALYKRLAELIDPGEDTTVDVYDLLPDEDREILRWVRGHGGLDEVRTSCGHADNRRIELCSALGIDTDTGWSDAMAEMLRRLMPEGMEWPRYENGEAFVPGEDDSVELFGDGIANVWINGDHQHLARGERVKRPSVLAGDGKPLEIGEKAWHIEDGRELVVIGLPRSGEYQGVAVRTDNGHITTFDPSLLTHIKPGPADSWDCINEESQLYTCEYFDHMGGSCHDCPGGPSGSCHANMMADVVRRCKALAEGKQS